MTLLSDISLSFILKFTLITLLLITPQGRTLLVLAVCIIVHILIAPYAAWLTFKGLKSPILKA